MSPNTWKWKIDGRCEHQTSQWLHLLSFDRIRSYWSEIRNPSLFRLFPLSVCSYLQMADWLYAGPSAALSAWPTWVCVRPRDSRRILNALANSRISSRLTPSTSLGAVCGSTIQRHKSHFISLPLPSCLAHFPEWMQQTSRRMQSLSSLNGLKIVMLWVRTYRAVNCMYPRHVLKNKFIWGMNAGVSWLWLASVNI